MQIGKDGWGCMYKQGGNVKQHKNMHTWMRRTIFANTCSWQQNKANFAVAKIPNREGNKHNFGRLGAAQDLYMNVSKGEHT